MPKSSLSNSFRKLTLILAVNSRILGGLVDCGRTICVRGRPSSGSRPRRSIILLLFLFIFFPCSSLFSIPRPIDRIGHSVDARYCRKIARRTTRARPEIKCCGDPESAAGDHRDDGVVERSIGATKSAAWLRNEKCVLVAGDSPPKRKMCHCVSGSRPVTKSSAAGAPTMPIRDLPRLFHRLG